MRQRRALTPERPDHPTRQKLVEATARQIQTVGFERVNVEVVLEEVGATKGALYHHFGSLNGMLVAGLLHAFEEGVRESEKWAIILRDNCRTAVEARDHVREVLRESQAPYREPFRSLRLHALSLVRTEPGLAGEIAQRQADLTDLATEAFRESQKRGWIRTDADPHVMAVLIQAITLGRIVDDVVDENRQMDVSAWRATTEAIFDEYFVVGPARA